MADLKDNELLIFTASATLFSMSKELQNIVPGISDTLLFLSDKLLSEVDIPDDDMAQVENSPLSEGIAPQDVERFESLNNEPTQRIDNCPDCGGVKQPVVHDENCPDCGGVKQPVHIHDENCTDCGGVKQDAPKLHIQELIKEDSADEAPQQGIVMDKNDPSTMCHGHTGDGPGSAASMPHSESTPPKKPHSTKVKDEVQSLIKELKEGLK